MKILFYTYLTVDSEREKKKDLMWISRRNLSAAMDCPWPTVGPNFTKHKSVAAISSLHTPENLSLNSQLPALCPACLCHLVNNYRETLILFFYQQTETGPIDHNWIIWIPHLHKTYQIENTGENFLYKRQLPLCLYGTQFATWIWTPGYSSFCSNKCCISLITV